MLGIKKGEKLLAEHPDTHEVLKCSVVGIGKKHDSTIYYVNFECADAKSKFIYPDQIVRLL